MSTSKLSEFLVQIKNSKTPKQQIQPLFLSLYLWLVPLIWTFFFFFFSESTCILLLFFFLSEGFSDLRLHSKVSAKSWKINGVCCYNHLDVWWSPTTQTHNWQRKKWKKCVEGHWFFQRIILTRIQWTSEKWRAEPYIYRITLYIYYKHFIYNWYYAYSYWNGQLFCLINNTIK